MLMLAVAAAGLQVQRSGQGRLVGNVVEPPTPGGPDILYFTGENCTVCHVAQRPALHRLRTSIPSVDVREIDVAADPQSARVYRVMTLPTTVILDASGRVSAINAGFAPESRLRTQVEAARAGAGAGAGDPAATDPPGVEHGAARPRASIGR